MAEVKEIRLYSKERNKFITMNEQVVTEDFLRRNKLERVPEIYEQPINVIPASDARVIVNKNGVTYIPPQPAIHTVPAESFVDQKVPRGETEVGETVSDTSENPNVKTRKRSHKKKK